MTRFLLPLLSLACLAQGYAAEDETTFSPRGTFKIVQHLEENWKQTLYFTGDLHRAITLENDVSWPATYYVSPDEHWILRIQKSGSGDNISFLYRLDDQHRLWRMEEQIGALGFAYLANRPGLPRNLYHTGIEFKAWDLKAGLLRYNIHGSDADQSGKGFDRPLVYNLRDQVISSP